MIRTIASTIVLISLAGAGGVEAQGLLGKLKSKAKQKAAERVDATAQEAVDSVANKTERSVRCTISDKLCLSQAQAAGQGVVVVDENGKPVSSEDSATTMASLGGSGGTAQPGAADAAETKPEPAANPACALLPREKFAEFVGDDPTQRPRPSEHQFPGGDVVSYSCRYGTRYNSWHVAIMLERGRTAEGLQAYVKNFERYAPKAVPGYPDRAMFGQVNPTNGMLHVIKGTDILTVQTHGRAAGAGSLAKTREIMDLVYPRFAALPRHAAPSE